MKFSFPCPACGQKIRIIRLMMAITPFFTSCPKCRSSVRAKGVALLGFLITFVLGVAMLIYITQYVSTHGSIDGTSLFSCFAFIIAIEFFVSLLVCNKAQIIVTKNRYTPPEK